MGYRAVSRTQLSRLGQLALHPRLRSTESNFGVRASQQISKRLLSEHKPCVRKPTGRPDTQLFVQAQPGLSAKLIDRWLRRHATTCRVQREDVGNIGSRAPITVCPDEEIDPPTGTLGRSHPGPHQRFVLGKLLVEPATLEIVNASGQFRRALTPRLALAYVLELHSMVASR